MVLQVFPRLSARKTANTARKDKAVARETSLFLFLSFPLDEKPDHRILRQKKKISYFWHQPSLNELQAYSYWLKIPTLVPSRGEFRGGK